MRRHSRRKIKTEVPVRGFRLTFFSLACCLCATSTFAQDKTPATVPSAIAGTPLDITAPSDAVPSNAPATVAVGTTHALIICGHPGDEKHLELYAQSVIKLRDGLIANYNVNEEQIAVLFGEGPEAFVKDEDEAAQPDERKNGNDSDNSDNDKDNQNAGESEDLDDESNTFAPPKWLASARTASRENLEEHVKVLSEKLQKEDSLWVITIGHSHLDKGRSWFNLPGPDLQQAQFAKLFEELPAQRQLFFVTTPASGYYIKTLSRPGRIIISATEADREINETLFPHALADIINQKPTELDDADEDGSISLFDVYIATVRNVADRYFDTTTIATEHAQLDDNGDRRTSEVQRHYLDEDHGGLPERKQRKTLRAGADGVVSRQIVFAKAVPQPAEATP